MDDLIEQVPGIVDAIRAQNWKNGGGLSVDRDEAIAVIEQLVRTAHSAGAVMAARETSDNILGALAKVMPTPPADNLPNPPARGTMGGGFGS